MSQQIWGFYSSPKKVKMVHCKTLLALVLATYLIGVYAEVDEAKLENDIKDAEFESVEEDSSEELTGRKDPKKHRCSCMAHNTCGCCLKPRILTHKFRGCCNVTLFAGQDKSVVEVMELKLTLEGSQVAQYNVTIKPVERICDRFPGKLSFLKICLYNNNTQTDDGGLLSCSSLDMIVKDSTAAILRFSCLQFKDNQLTFVNQENVDRDSMMSLKIKNPIALVTAFFGNKK